MIAVIISIMTHINAVHLVQLIIVLTPLSVHLQV